MAAKAKCDAALMIGFGGPTRADEVRPCLDHDAVMAMAPDAEDGRFAVPRILGEAP